MSAKETERAQRLAADRILRAVRQRGLYGQRGRNTVRILSSRDYVLRELDAAYSRGYADAYEQQMQMRIMDAKERA